jgi:hypothetical protein
MPRAVFILKFILILTSFGECRIGFGIHSSDYGLRAADTDPKHEWRILYG